MVWILQPREVAERARIKDVAGGADNAPPPSLVVVQNWFEELKRLAPAK